MKTKGTAASDEISILFTMGYLTYSRNIRQKYLILLAL